MHGYSGPPQWGPPQWIRPAPPEQPSAIKSAVALMWGGVTITLLGLPLPFVLEDEIRASVADQQPTLTSSELDLAITVGLVVGVASALIAVALWSVNAVFCGRGRPWSRIFGTVLFGISMAGLPFSLIQPTPGISRIFQVVAVLLSIGAVVFLWLPESNRFFRESERARRGY